MIKSDKIEAVGAALFQVQGKIPPVKKDAKNPFTDSRYAKLETVWEVALPLLQEAGIYISSFPDFVESGAISVTTIAVHPASGQYIGGMMTVPFIPEAKKSAGQVVGSMISYARRYSIAALLGIVHDDDDGNMAGTRGGQDRASSPVRPQAPSKPAGPDPGIVRAVQEELYGLFLAAGVAQADAVKRVQYFGDNVDLLNAKIDEIKSNGGNFNE